MKFALTLVLLALAVSIQAQDPLNLMTFNIRLNLASDSLNAWPYRRDKVSSQVLFHEAHIVGVQEALPAQMNDMKEDLKQYRSTGVARDDGKEKGEFSAIFFDTIRLQLLQTATFWLSETPAVAGSKGWDASYPRIVTWAKFKDRKTKKVFYCFNTHFDHMGKVARRESALMLKRRVQEIAGKYPTIITGDFNAIATDEPIRILLDSTQTDRFIDSKAISRMSHYGPTTTFTAFKNITQDGPLIDYIFIKNKVQVLQHATLSQVWNNRFASDHFAVFAKVIVP